VTALRLRLKSLWGQRRLHLAPALGVALAAAALGGSLLTGISVRNNLERLVERRLGNVEWLISAEGFFPASLAGIFRPEARVCGMVALEGELRRGEGAQRERVDVFGVDAGFFEFQGAAAGAPDQSEALLSPALAARFGARPGDQLNLLLALPSATPRELPYGPRGPAGISLRVRVGAAVTAPVQKEFALHPRQGDVLNVYLALDHLQRELKIGEQINRILLAGWSGEGLARRLRARFRLEDMGLRLRPGVEPGEVILEPENRLLSDPVAEGALEAGKSLGILTRAVVARSAEWLRAGSARIPYPVVAAVDEGTLAEINGDRPLSATRLTPIVLNEWAAADLRVRPGDKVSLDHPIRSDAGRLGMETVEFEVAGVAGLRGMAADRDLRPLEPLVFEPARLRPRDAEYRRLHGATPLAWIPLGTGRQLWGTRFGSYTSIRFLNGDSRLERTLRQDIDPLRQRFTLIPVKRQGLAAAAGSTRFGDYFVSFNLFVILAALAGAALWFRWGLERRHSETALLWVLGTGAGRIRAGYFLDGLGVALAGCLLGGLLSPLYAAFLLNGLSGWWIAATGMGHLDLDLDGRRILAGASAALALAALAFWQAVRWLPVEARVRPAPAPESGAAPWGWKVGMLVPAALALIILGLVPAGLLGAGSGALLSGACLLLSGLSGAAWWIRSRPLSLLAIPGRRTLWRLSARNIAWCGRRSTACLFVIAPSIFVLVSLEASGSRRPSTQAAINLYAESIVPVVPAPGAPVLPLQGFGTGNWIACRLKPGDDISRLNLYRPMNPRLLGVPPRLFQGGRFRFAGSTGESPETRAKPWLLLDAQLNSGVTPAIVEQRSLDYVLRRKLGDEVVLERAGGPPLRLKIVATLEGSPLQSEILISERSFARLFPQLDGSRVFLSESDEPVPGELERALPDSGLTVMPASQRLSGYRRVERTYLSIFQSLSCLGLLLGGAALGAVAMRSRLDRTRELLWFRAAGCDERTAWVLTILELSILAVAGVLLGALTAAVAVAPGLDWPAALWTAARTALALFLVLLGGTVASSLALRAERQSDRRSAVSCG
jgi:hypothetical protein